MGYGGCGGLAFGDWRWLLFRGQKIAQFLERSGCLFNGVCWPAEFDFCGWVRNG